MILPHNAVPQAKEKSTAGSSECTQTLYWNTQKLDELKVLSILPNQDSCKPANAHHVTRTICRAQRTLKMFHTILEIEIRKKTKSHASVHLSSGRNSKSTESAC